MNIKNLFNEKGIFEIHYIKSVGTASNIVVNDFRPSEKYGEQYVEAQSYWRGEYMTLRIDRIQSIKQLWVQIKDPYETAPETGVYVFVYTSDNHQGLEVYRMEKGERLWKYFIGEYAHGGWMDGPPYGYYFIEDFNKDCLNGGWQKSETEEPNGIRKDYVIAIENENGEIVFSFNNLAYSAPKLNIKGYHQFFDPIHNGWVGHNDFYGSDLD